MAYPIDLVPQQLVTLPRASLVALRAALLRDAGAGYAGYLQEAGYAGGETVFQAFQDWLAARGAENVDALSVPAFVTQAAGFFHESGWGSLTVDARHDVVAIVAAAAWAESDPDARLDHPACHWTTGMFADFFGRVALGGRPAVPLHRRLGRGDATRVRASDRRRAPRRGARRAGLAATRRSRGTWDSRQAPRPPTLRGPTAARSRSRWRGRSNPPRRARS